ncbi:MAG: MlaD family protein [Bdellovibrionota bacterium]
MDRKIANNVVLGIFVTLGFVGFLFILFNVGGGSGVFASDYELVAHFPNVKGLHYGSEVSLSGLRVGVVESIEVKMDGSKELVVRFSVLKSVQDRIRQDSTAKIATQGVLGDKYIELSIGTADSPMLKDGDEIETETESDLFSKGGDLVGSIERQFREGGDVEKLLKSLTRLSNNLNAITAELKIQRGGNSLAKSLAHLESILKKIDKGDGTVGALVNDPTLYEDTKSLIGGAQRSNILKYFINQFVDDGEKAAKEKEKEKKTGNTE